MLLVYACLLLFLFYKKLCVYVMFMKGEDVLITVIVVKEGGVKVDLRLL